MKSINNLNNENQFLSDISKSEFSSNKNSNYIINSSYIRGKKIDLLTRYYLYYYISLERFVSETSFDNFYLINKLQTLNLKFNISKVLTKIDEIYKRSKDKKEFEEFLRTNASITALEDFISADKELFNTKYYEKNKKELIESDKFFDKKMYDYLEKEYMRVYKYFNTILSTKN